MLFGGNYLLPATIIKRFRPGGIVAAGAFGYRRLRFGG